MAENTQRSRGRPGNYKFDRGGVAAEMGPYIGIVVNNVDTVRTGRLQVYIEEFGATNADGSPNLTDPTLWRTVSYCPPFYGATPGIGGSAGVGTYPGNRNSYGMWFTPPDLGVKVICFFVGGDPSAGYYLGCIPEPGLTHMIPAIGSSNKYVPGNANQTSKFANSPLMPVTEINEKNTAINENPKFYDQPRPTQSIVAGILWQQGLNKDPIRGPIRSNSQRESPSTVYGISTPGTAIYQGGMDPKTIRRQLEKGEIKPQDVAVIGRMGGHTLVMDDGDLDGNDQLVRIRTSKGHQITMSDDGDCFYITHANGQTWMEFGKQGTVDVYSTNSINLRTEGTLNLHADKNINMYAGGQIRIKSERQTALESTGQITLNAQKSLLMYSKATLGIRADGTLALKGKASTWDGGKALNLKATVINLNGAATAPVPEVPVMNNYKLVDTEFKSVEGWIVKPGALETIVTRAPTHEPYPYHGKGVNSKADLNNATVPVDPSANVSATDSISSRESLVTKAAKTATTVTETPIVNPITIERYLSEPPNGDAIGEEAEQAFRDASTRTTPTIAQTPEQAAAAVAAATGINNTALTAEQLAIQNLSINGLPVNTGAQTPQQAAEAVARAQGQFRKT
jgi:hypothetical protein